MVFVGERSRDTNLGTVEEIYAADHDIQLETDLGKTVWVSGKEEKTVCAG